jgi:hypothetical protein
MVGAMLLSSAFVALSLVAASADEAPAPSTPPAAPAAPAAPVDDVLEVGAITSRPGFADAANVVPTGYILTNVGLNVESTLGTPESYAIPDFMLRVGVAESLELRVGGFMATSGSLPVAAFAAAGVQVIEEDDVAPGLIALFTVFLPPEPDPAGTVVEGRLSGAKAFGDFGLNANVGMLAGPQTSGWLATVGAGYGIMGLSPFIELYGEGGFGPTTTLPSIGCDFGFGYQITRDLAVDLSAGSVFLGRPDAFISAGLSWLAH